MNVRSAAVWVLSAWLQGTSTNNFAAALPPAWETKAQIAPNEMDLYLGWSIDVSDDTLIAGSWNRIDLTSSATVFIRTSAGSNLDWEQQGEPLVVNDGEGGSYYGYRVAIDGDTALISATKMETQEARLFVFERSDGVWEQTKMLHSDGIDDGNILRIALDGDTAAIGQPINSTWEETTESWIFQHGKVFVYTRSSDGFWSDEPQVLLADDKADGDYFGDSIAISGTRMIVGASEQGPVVQPCNHRGKVYAFVKDGDEWVQDGEPLLPDDEVTDLHFHFGTYVALDGDTALIGHDCWDCLAYSSQNQMVHVFTRSAEGWVQLLKLKPSDLGLDPQDVTGFGRGVELQGNRALIWSDWWSGWPTAVMLENWEYIERENIPGDPYCYGFQRCGMIALSSDAIFFGGRPYLNTGESLLDKSGSVFVVDNHSVLPLGRDDVTIRWTFAGPTPYGPVLYLGINTGYGRKFDFLLLQKDCSSAIADGSSIFHNINVERFRWSVTENGYSVFVNSNPELIEDNAIYNRRTGKVEICAKVLVDSAAKYQEVFEIQHTYLGLFTFMGSRTSRNSILASYVIKKDRLDDFRTALLQKDCSSPITDTNITKELHHADYWDNKYDFIDFIYTLDPATVRASVIFDKATSTIQVCHAAWLRNSDNRAKQIITIKVPAPGTFGGMFGDPHIITFDGLQYDCQAAGEFTTLTSLEDPTFKIQERFTAVNTDSCGQASVSTGVAFRDTDKPVVQISTPRAEGASSLNEVNGCPLDLYVDGEAQYLDINLTTSNIELIQESDRVKIKHTDTYVTLDVVVRASDSFGCHIMVQVALPGSFRDGETLLGLLGTPNEDTTDDWRTPSGEVLQAPVTDAESLFSTAYSYCVENWCVGDDIDSLFTYGLGESFEEINHCDVPFSSEVEDAVINLVEQPNSNQQELADACGGSLICLVDGVCGSISDAVEALSNEQEIVETQLEVKAAIFPREEMKVQNVVAVVEEEQTPSAKPTAPKIVDPFWYPAWDKGSKESVCLNDGEASKNAKSTGLFFSATREACCERFYRWDKVTCLGEAAATPPGFYPNWGHPEQKCLNSTAQIGQENSLPDYMINNPQQWMYPDIESCCKKYYSWDVHECIVESGGSSEKLTPPGFYPNWGYPEDKCLNSTAQIGQENALPDYMANNPRQWIYDDIESCCKKYYSWDVNSCIVKSGGIVTIKYTNKWYVNQEEQLCQQDCLEDPSAPTCGGAVESWNGLYDSAEACCAYKLFWIPSATCVQQSMMQPVTGSKKWYVDWVLQKCVKDCESGDNCGGLAKTYNTLYNDVEICCSMLFWKDRSKCVLADH